MGHTSTNRWAVYGLLSAIMLLPLLNKVHAIKDSKAATDESVSVFNIQWQPYYYKNHNKISGHAKDIVQQVLVQSGVTGEFGFDTWSNIFEMGLSKPNTIIAGIGRTDKRENLFYWIGPVNKEQNIYVFGLKEHQVDISTVEELGGYLTAVERHMYYHDFMVKMGFEKQTYPVADISSLIKLMMSRRVDFILMEKERMELEVRNLGYNPDNVEAKALAFSAQSYMTLSKSSAKSLFDKLKQSYDALERQNKIYLH